MNKTDNNLINHNSRLAIVKTLQLRRVQDSKYNFNHLINKYLICFYALNTYNKFI